MTVETQIDSALPAVDGRMITCTFNEMEHRFKVYLMREQRKPNPDNGLIAVLCDGVRLVREHLDFVRSHDYGSAISEGASDATNR